MQNHTTTLPAPAPAHAPRIDYASVSPTALPALLALQQAADRGGLEQPLLELAKLRASQLNRCAFCIEMHTREAREAGEREDRLHLTHAWEEAGVFTPREQAALRWTEALTRLTDHGVSDEDFANAREHFSELELTHLTLAIVAINSWNRFNVAFRIPPRFGE